MNHAVNETHAAQLAPRSRAAMQPLMLRVLLGLCVVALQVARIGCCALLVLIEPVLRAIAGADRVSWIPRDAGVRIPDRRSALPALAHAGVLGGTLMLYWLFLGLMSLFMTLPADHDGR